MDDEFLGSVNAKSYVMLDNWFSPSPKNVRTLILLGPPGSGKSSTGNSIIGDSVFESESSFDGAANSFMVRSKEFADGLTVNVIDTPGLYVFPSMGIEHVADEYMKSLYMVKGGITAVLLVLSAGIQYTKVEVSTIANYLAGIYGHSIYDYMIVVFTHGDVLKSNDETLDGFLSKPFAEPILNLVSKCGYRKVLVDNKSPGRRGEQLEYLLALVEEVVNTTKGKQFADQVLASLKISGHSTVKEAAYAVLKQKCQKYEPPSLEIHDAKEETYSDHAENEMARAGSPSPSANEVLDQQVQRKIDQPADFAANEADMKDFSSENEVLKHQVQRLVDQPADFAANEADMKDLSSDKLIPEVESGELKVNPVNPVLSIGEPNVIGVSKNRVVVRLGTNRNLGEAAKDKGGLSDLL